MRRSNDRLTALFMLLPSLILLAIFVYGFIGRTAYVSTTDWGSNPAQALALNPQLESVGLANYLELFTSRINARFRQDLVNTFFFTIFFLAGCLGLGLGLAILLDQKVRGEAIFRTIFLYPFALAFIVTGTIWRWLLQPQGGINVLPTLAGLPKLEWPWLTTRQQVWRFNWQDVPAFLIEVVAAVLLLLAWRAWRGSGRGGSGRSGSGHGGSERGGPGYGGARRRRAAVLGLVGVVLGVWGASGAPGVSILPYSEMHGFNVAFIGIVLAAVWQMSGYTMALYLAGLRGIPEELREAARADGASEFQVYRHVILPLLGPITLSAMIILGHISLKIFDLIWAMAGADNAITDVPALLMYLRSFRANQFASGASIAMVLLVMVAAIIIPYLWTSLRGEVRR